MEKLFFEAFGKSAEELSLLKDNDSAQKNKINEALLEISRITLLFEAYQRGLPNWNNSQPSYLDKLSQSVFHVVLSFLDVKSLLKTRLVCVKFNVWSTNYLPKKIESLETQYKRLTESFEVLNSEIENIVPEQIQFDGLDQLQKSQVVEVKSYAKPPTLVLDVFGILTPFILNKKVGENQIWQETVQLLSHSEQFLHQLQNFDKDKINSFQLQLLKRLDTLNVDRIQQISIATSIFFQWLLSMKKFTESHYFQSKLKLNLKTQQKNTLGEQISKLSKMTR